LHISFVKFKFAGLFRFQLIMKSEAQQEQAQRKPLCLLTVL